MEHDRHQYLSQCCSIPVIINYLDAEKVWFFSRFLDVSVVGKKKNGKWTVNLHFNETLLKLKIQSWRKLWCSTRKNAKICSRTQQTWQHWYKPGINLQFYWKDTGWLWMQIMCFHCEWDSLTLEYITKAQPSDQVQLLCLPVPYWWH